MSSRTRKLTCYLLLALILGFTLLTLLVMMFPESKIDLEFSEEIQERSNPFLDKVMKAISWPGYTLGSITLVLSSSLSFFIFRYKKEALFMLLTSLSGVISASIKVAINRPRPSSNIVHIVEHAKRQSFPSGHTLFYVVFFGFLVMLMIHHTQIPKPVRRVVIYLSLFMIFSVPISRVYLGAHWFSDVLAGFLTGLIYLIVLILLYFRRTDA